MTKKEKDLSSAFQENWEARIELLRDKLLYAEVLIYQARAMLKQEADYDREKIS